MTVLLYTLSSVFLTSLISLIGVVTLSWRQENLKKIAGFLVSLATGALFGDALIHLLPEAFEKIENSLLVSLAVILGILIFFVLEKFLHWRHCHIPTSKKHWHPLITMNLVGDGVHNFIDGLLIGATFAVSITLGLATTLAIVLHEIPQEIGDFGVLIHAGLPVKKAILFNFCSSLLAILGAGVALILGRAAAGLATIFLPIAAGGFIYIAGADLIPELKHECEAVASLKQFLLIILGVALMALLLLFE